MIQLITRYHIEQDIETVAALVERLVPYVYESELYGLMPDHLPKLTVGRVLMLLHRLTAMADQLSSDQQQIVQTAQKKFNQIHHDWSIAVKGKIRREFESRLKAINEILSDCNDNAGTCLEDYPVTAENRMLLEALKDGADNPLAGEMKSMLLMLDNRLRRYTRPGDFLLDSSLERAYPHDQFWFLYVTRKINQV